jgi:hypothetical protein
MPPSKCVLIVPVQPTSQHTDDWDFDSTLDLMYYAGNRHRVFRTLWICGCGFERRREMWEDHLARGSVSERAARTVEWNAFLRHKYGDNFVTDESARLEKLWAEKLPTTGTRHRVANLDWWLVMSISIALVVYAVLAQAMK